MTHLKRLTLMLGIIIGYVFITSNLHADEICQFIDQYTMICTDVDTGTVRYIYFN